MHVHRKLITTCRVYVFSLAAGLLELKIFHGARNQTISPVGSLRRAFLCVHALARDLIVPTAAQLRQ